MSRIIPSSTGPKFKVGDRVTVNYGQTFGDGDCKFTLKITKVYANYGGGGLHRYYGVAARRGDCGVYESQIDGLA